MKKKGLQLLVLAVCVVIFCVGCSPKSPMVSDGTTTQPTTTTTPSGSDNDVDADIFDDLWGSDDGTDSTDTWVPDDGDSGDEGSGPILFTKLSPADKVWAETVTPTFEWAKLPDGTVYTLQIFIYRDKNYRKVREITNITDNTYTLKENEKLAENELYRWKLIAVYDGIRYAADNGTGGLFVSKFNPETHPANVGLDYTFEGKISEEVLNNYLDRSMTFRYADEPDMWQENLRVILYTGTKYVGRANVGQAWKFGAAEIASHEEQKELLEKAHEYDPEIIFEGGVFEVATRDVESYAIPAYVFEDLGYEVEKRNFIFEDMINTTHSSLSGTSIWASEDYGTPDISKKEAQLWFYYRATMQIDLGYEAIHMGNFSSIVVNDTNYEQFTIIVNKIREYGKKHARRGFVLLNAHTHGVLQSDRKTLMFDFHEWPMFPVAPRDEVPHKATDDNPQRLMLIIGPTPIYQKSAPNDGKSYLTPSGWECTNGLPYTVELDNAGGKQEEIGIPTYSITTGHVWGLDEIGWFATQPQNYRTYWLQYSVETVSGFDEDGHVMMPGSRGYTNTVMGRGEYRCNNPEWGYSSVEAQNDEETIRSIWISRNTAGKADK